MNDSQILKKDFAPWSELHLLLNVFTDRYQSSFSTVLKVFRWNYMLTIYNKYRRSHSVFLSMDEIKIAHRIVWSSHNGNCENYYHPGCDLLWNGRNLPAFRKNILLSFLGVKNKPRKRATSSLILPCCVYSSNPKVEVIRSSERPVNFSWYPWRHI
jgi:hypothetical protein